MIMFFTFVCMCMQFLCGACLEEADFTNTLLCISSTGFYYHYLQTHVNDPSISLVYTFEFIALFIVLMCAAKHKPNFNFIGLLLIFNVLSTLYYLAVSLKCIF